MAKEFAQQHSLTDAQTGWVVGLLMASFSAMQFLFLPLWGRLSDMFGRRPILLIGLTGSTLFYALFGLASMWGSLPWLFVARIGAGIAGATISTAQAYIADTTSAQNRTQGMALIGAAFALGFTIGPLLGAVSLLVGSPGDTSPWPGFLAAGLSACALLLALWQLPESRTPDSASARRAPAGLARLATGPGHPHIAALLLASFIVVLALAAFESTLALAIESLHDSALADLGGGGGMDRVINWMTALGYGQLEENRLAIVLGTFAYLVWSWRWPRASWCARCGTASEGTMAVRGTWFSVVSSVAVERRGAWENFLWLCVGMALFVVGIAFVTPALQSLVSRRISPAQQGHILGVGQSLSSLARILGPVAGIRLFAESPQFPLWSATGVMALAAILTIVAVRSGQDHVG